ncbi:hypothetical protein TNCV_4689161 [Trichonephila clavipes]|nr:hypothetical protein TNCV_4689161 [Trichonephila clavipes]
MVDDDRHIVVKAKKDHDKTSGSRPGIYSDTMSAPVGPSKWPYTLKVVPNKDLEHRRQKTDLAPEPTGSGGLHSTGQSGVALPGEYTPDELRSPLL